MSELEPVIGRLTAATAGLKDCGLPALADAVEKRTKTLTDRVAKAERMGVTSSEHTHAALVALAEESESVVAWFERKIAGEQ